MCALGTCCRASSTPAFVKHVLEARILLPEQPLQSLCGSRQDACDYVTRLAADMPLYTPEHTLNGSFLHDDWRPDLVRPSC